MDVWRVLLRGRRSCTTHPLTSPLMPPTTNALLPANTTATARITAFRPSKRRNSSIQRHRRSSTFTVRRRGREAMQRCARNLPAGTRASCRRWSPTRATTASGYEKHSAITGYVPLVKHCVRTPYDHAHNARIDDDLYGQRSMTETANSSVKRSYGSAVRARECTASSVKLS